MCYKKYQIKKNTKIAKTNKYLSTIHENKMQYKQKDAKQIQNIWQNTHFLQNSCQFSLPGGLQ